MTQEDNRKKIEKVIDEDFARFHLHVPQDTRARIISIAETKKSPVRERDRRMRKVVWGKKVE